MITQLPIYETPSVVTYTDAEILEELGPASTFVTGYTPPTSGGGGGPA